MAPLRWLFAQPLLVQLAIVIVPIVAGGLFIWALLGRRNRLLRNAERAAQRAMAEARAEGLPVRSCWVTGAVDVDPSVLAIVFHLTDDVKLAEAEKSGAAQRLYERTATALREAGYPVAAGSISLVSDETVDRLGGPSVYFR